MKQSMRVNVLQLLSKDSIERIARETKFVERQSPISGTNFLLALVAGAQSTAEGTLTELATFLYATCGVVVSPQAVDARFNATAVAFLETCLGNAMAVLVSAPHRMQALAMFKHVYAMDSTNFNLSQNLAAVFKGNGGAASTAAMRVQFVLDFCTGAMYFEVGDVTLSDPVALANLINEERVPMDGECLFLSDLGYFKSSTFASIGRKKGLFFLSKLKLKVKLLRADETELKLNQILKSSPNYFEEAILLDGVLCRVIGIRINDEVAGQRIRRANIESKSKSAQITEDFRQFLHYAIFITNLPACYTMEQLYTLYRIRWQVELVFKTWKSIFRLDKQRSGKEARVRCEVYGRLIASTLTSLLECLARSDTKDLVISRHKAAKIFKAWVTLLATAVSQGEKYVQHGLRKIKAALRKLGKKSCHKKKPCIEKLLSDARFPMTPLTIASVELRLA